MKAPRSLTSAALLPALLTACAGPPIKTANVPPVTPASDWRTPPVGDMAVGDHWWTAFGDPVLDRLVGHVLASNPDLGIAIGRVREARSQERLARAALLPSLDAGLGEATSRSVSPFLTPSEQTAAQPQVQLNYEVDLFGRLADEKTAANKAYLASAAARDATRLAIASTAASGYITLRALDARLQVARETLASRAAALKLAQSRARAGYSPMLDLRQAEAEYQATARVVPQIELAISRQENALSILAGDPPGPIERGRSLSELILPTVAAGLPSDLLRRRPDIAEAELRLAASDASLAAARKRFLPQVRLSGSAGLALSTLLNDPITLWSAGGSILAPLFEGGRLTAQAEGAAARRDEAAYAYRRTVLNALREVEDTLAASDRLGEQRAASAVQVDKLSDTLRLATNRYREGYSPYLEQLDAERSLFAAQLGLIDDEAATLTNRVQLFAALGGGWAME